MQISIEVLTCLRNPLGWFCCIPVLFVKIFVTARIPALATAAKCIPDHAWQLYFRKRKVICGLSCSTHPYTCQCLAWAVKVLWLSILSIQVVFAEETVGTIDGVITVGPTGQTAYSIPIAVPPGIAGVQPELAISYNSLSSNGPLGVGWTISGFSTVTRCPSRLRQDNAIRGVRHDGNDRLCLDGQRLVQISSDGSGNIGEFRKEIDDFTRIMTYPGATGGPEYIKAWTKSGLIFSYGTTLNSRVYVGLGTTSPISEWKLRQISDLHGNSIYFYYYQDSATQEVLPSAAVYTAHFGRIAASRAVILRYDLDRPDQQTAFVAGKQRRLLRRLQAVETYVGVTNGLNEATLSQINPAISGRVAKKYLFSYEADPSAATGRTRLASVTECGQENDGSLLCYPPTRFSYTGENASQAYCDQDCPGRSTDFLNFDGQVDGKKMRGTGDFNGDGQVDLLFSNLSEEQMSLYVAGFKEWNTPFSEPTGITAGPLFTGYNNPRVISGDFDGNGLSDLFLFNVASSDRNFGTNTLYLNRSHETGNGTLRFDKKIGSQANESVIAPSDFKVVTRLIGSTTQYVSPEALTSGDFNGDGITDLLLKNPCAADAEAGGNNCSAVRLYLGSPAGEFVAMDVPTIPTGPRKESTGRVVFTAGDFDADGLTDVAYLRTTDALDRTPFFVYFGNGNGSFSQSTQSFASYNVGNDQPLMYQRVGDFNGDGIGDILNYANRGGTQIMLGRGDRTFSIVTQPTIVWDDYTAYIADSNGDGLSDIFTFRPRDGHGALVISDGCGQMTATQGVECHFINPSQNPEGTLFKSGSATFDYAAIEVGDFNGDGLADLFSSRPNATHLMYINQQRVYDRNERPLIGDLLQKVTNGLGHESLVVYAPLTTAAVYIPEPSGAVSPAQNGYQTLRGSLYVVKDLVTGNGKGGFITTRHQYVKGRLDEWGGGFFGFSEVRAQSLDRGITERTQYLVDSHITAGIVTRSEAFFTHSGALISRTLFKSTLTVTNEFQGRRTYFRYISGDTKAVFDPYTNASIGYTANSYQYDRFGNLTRSDSQVYDREGGGQLLHKVLENLYANNYVDATDTWVIGRLWCATATDTRPGQTTQSRMSAFEYDTFGQLLREIIEPGDRMISTPGMTAQPCGLADSSRNAITLITEYTYDDFGEMESTRVFSRDASVPARTTTTRYLSESDHNSLTPTLLTTNSLGHETRQIVDARWGMPLSVRDPNDLMTAWVYDSLGRPLLETHPGGSKRMEYRSQYAGCPSPLTVAAVYVNNAGHGWAATCIDSLGRTLRTITDGPKGLLISGTEFDNLGRVLRSTRNGQNTYTEQQDYDVLDRPHRVLLPDGSYQELIYNGLTSIINIFAHSSAASSADLEPGQYAHLPQTTTQVKNALGELVHTTDAVGTTKYVYQASGWLKEINYPAPGGGQRTIDYQYDARGRLTQQRDPDQGTWTYAYYPTGELKTRTDAKLQVTRMEYDALGRNTVRIDDDTGTRRTVNRWTYDSAPRSGGTWKGALHTITQYGSTYQEEHSYDSLGRPQQVLTRHPNGDAFTVTNEYDSTSRLRFVTYPNNGPRLEYRYANGETARLATVVDSATNSVLWMAGTRNADGNLLDATWGNGVSTARTYDNADGRLTGIRTGRSASGQPDGTLQQYTYRWDPLGNLLLRRDNRQNVSERFFYDGGNRLTKVTRNGTVTRAYSYDVLGNMTYNFGTGFMKFQETNGAGPHAVTHVTYQDSANPPPVLTSDLDGDGVVTGKDYLTYTDLMLDPTRVIPSNANCDPQDAQLTVIDLVCAKKTMLAFGNKSGDHLGDYVYDANGQLTQGGGRTLSYTAFNQPLEIARVSVTGNASVRFEYTPTQERMSKIARVRTVGQAEAEWVTTYVGGLYERSRRPDGTVEHRYFVYTEGLLVAMQLRTDSATHWRYVHTDHLGSVDKITDAQGNLVEDASFDAFGQRRLASGWQDGTDPDFTTAQARRGYTGHEQLDELGLVHMNGRLYDPILGRFLTPDPLLDPFNPRDTNRYAYVYNNPLSFTDPSGYRSNIPTMGKIFVAVVAATIASTGVGAAVEGAVWAGMAAGAAGGAAAAASVGIMSGGDLGSGQFWRAVGIGALTGMAFGAVGDWAQSANLTGSLQHALAHGAVGGVSNLLSGESFGPGFAAAFFTARADGWLDALGGGPIAQGLAAAAVGGTASALGGGKFANGAMTGAFSRLLNACGHGKCNNPLKLEVVTELLLPMDAWRLLTGQVPVTWVNIGMAILDLPTPAKGASVVLKIGVKSAVAKSTVQANKVRGDAFRDEIADLMRKEGRDIQTEVTKQTPFGKRVIDIEVSKDDKVLGGIETKKGNSRYTPSQRAKDEWLRQNGYPVDLVRDP